MSVTSVTVGQRGCHDNAGDWMAATHDLEQTHVVAELPQR